VVTDDYGFTLETGGVRIAMTSEDRSHYRVARSR
jgi:hypothetical protein